MIATVQADGLVAAKLDRLSRSLIDFTTILAWTKQDAALVVLDFDLDTSTLGNRLGRPGRGRLIGQRTRDALAVRKAQGVRLGRPPVLPAEVVSRIVSAHKSGASWSSIGRALDTDGVPTAQGGARWYPATVRAVYLAAAGEAA